MKDAPVWTTPIDESPTGSPPIYPYAVVECQCPRKGYVLQQTLDIVAEEGVEPQFVCRHCATPEVREIAEAMIQNAPHFMHGATVKIVLGDDDEDEEETIH